MVVQCEGALYDKASNFFLIQGVRTQSNFILSILKYFERRLESVSIPGLSLPYCTVLRFKATLIFSFQVVELGDGCKSFGCQEAFFF